MDVGIPTKLEELKEEELPFLCESAADACAPGNPCHAPPANFEGMFRRLILFFSKRKNRPKRKVKNDKREEATKLLPFT